MQQFVYYQSALFLHYSMLNTFLIFIKTLHLCMHVVNNPNTFEREEGVTMAFANGAINRFKILQPILIVVTLSVTKQNKKN